MSPSVLGGVVAVALVVIIAAAFRGKGTAAADVVRPPDERVPEDAATDESGEEDFDDDEEDPEVVAVTSDGFALVPDKHAVRLMPPDESGEEWKAGDAARQARGARALDMSWHAGDFTGGRIVRGEADEGPWRFEAMGRSGEYTAFVFETREGADAALKAFESRGVIRLGRDEDDNVVPPSPEQFAEARRVFLETEAALDAPDEEEGH